LSTSHRTTATKAKIKKKKGQAVLGDINWKISNTSAIKKKLRNYPKVGHSTQQLI
jgi:hypothetical protein